VQLHPDAEGDLCEAALRYEDQVAGLGDDLLAEVERWLEILPETPDTWPRWPDAPHRHPPVRRALLRRFPFAIAYQAFEDRILVLAVAHTSRRPFYWGSRSDAGDSHGPG
jgi:hypothetical protein